jgi:hypothetical protein
MTEIRRRVLSLLYKEGGKRERKADEEGAKTRKEEREREALVMGGGFF